MGTVHIRPFSKFRVILASALSLALWQMPAKAGADLLSVRIDPAKTQGQWEGWGVSLCWWAKVFGNRDDLADLLFTTKDVEFEGQRLPGLGLNILRYNAGACSWKEFDGRRMIVSKTILPLRPTSLRWGFSVFLMLLA